MSKSIKISHSQWVNIRSKILEKHPLSVVVIRDVMKRELGFTTREHTEWLPKVSRYDTVLYLDFYDEKKRTYFLLKYGDYITDAVL